MGFATVVATILVAASVAYACTVMVPQTSGNMEITPNTNIPGSATDIIVRGECNAGTNGCKNVTPTQSQTGDLYYARCGALTAATSHCGPAGVDPIPPGGLGDAHTFHNTICDGDGTAATGDAQLSSHSTIGNNDVTISHSGFNLVNKVEGQGSMPSGLTQGIYVICADVNTAGGPSYEFLYNFFTYL